MAEIVIPLLEDISLGIGTEIPAEGVYPTGLLQKGLLLMQEGISLAEEGVGFGVPVAKRGRRTIFPGHMELVSHSDDRSWTTIAYYKMDLEEKIYMPRMGSVEYAFVYNLKNSLAELHRRHPASRGLLTMLSNGLRRSLGLETLYQQAEFYGIVRVTFKINCDLGRILVEVDTAGLRKELLTEIVVMNEQGARHFDHYEDSSGICLQGGEIGTWDEVTAEEASFVCDESHLAFSLRQVYGASLFRGRELIGSRLAWSGFGYLLDLNNTVHRYNVQIRRCL